MKKIVFAALAATFLSGVAHADLYNNFIGANGGTRTITDSVTDGNVTTFTVETLKTNGNIVTRTFTATNIDGEFTISGNGKAEFKDFLAQHAAAAQAITTEQVLTKNEIAFNAWRDHMAAKGGLFADNFARLEYTEQNFNKNFVELTETLGVDVDYSILEPQITLGSTEEAPALTNEEAYVLWNENRGNAVYTPYQYVSTIDWVSMYADEVAADEAANAVDASAYQAAVNETVQAQAERDAIAAAEAAAEREAQRYELYGSESTRLVRQASEDISDKSVMGIADFGSYQMIDYDRVNVRGLEAAHADGWTGKDIVVGVVDTAGYRGHGDYVARAVLDVAPGATVNHSENHRYDRDFRNVDIINRSGDSYVDMLGGRWNPAPIESIKNHVLPQNLGFQNNNPGALIVTIHPNVTVCRDFAVEDCSGTVRAHNEGLLNDNWIFVRSSGWYESHAAGNSDIKNHTITAHGQTTNNWIGGGTSFAAPKVAGAAALVMHKYPNLVASEVKDVLLDSAFTDFDGYSLEHHGRGILDVGAALSPLGDIN